MQTIWVPQTVPHYDRVCTAVFNQTLEKMLLNIAKVLIVLFVLVKVFFIVVPEENRIAEMFRNTLKNDQNSSRLMKSSSKR